MMRLFLVVALAAIAGCSVILGDDCLYDATGCALPGDWRLVSINGEAATGRMEIAEGFVDRQTYAVLPTGNAQYPEMRGASPADYSLDPDDPQRFDLDLWRMDVEVGAAVYVDLSGRVEIDGDRMTYRVIRGEAERIGGGVTIPLDFPILESPGTVFEFRR